MSRKPSPGGAAKPARAAGLAGRPDLRQLIGLAAAYMERGEWALAEQLCQRILQVDTSNCDALQISGLIAANTGRLEQADALLSRAARAAPGDAAVHFNHGNVLATLGRPRDALAGFDRALRLDPRLFQAHNNRGNELLKLRRPEEALASCERALAIEPRCAEAHATRAGALQALGRYEEALAGCDDALRVSPGLADAQCTRGFTLAALGRRQEALDSLGTALRLNPNHVLALFGAADIQLQLGKPEEALGYCERALQLQPSGAEGHVTHGRVLRSLRRYAAALGACDQALAIDPHAAVAHSLRGTVLQDLGRFQEALQSYQRSLAIDPGDPETHRNCAGVLQASGRHPEAVPHLERAFELSPDDAWLPGTLLTARMQTCAWQDFDARLATLVDLIGQGRQAVQPFALLALVDSAALQRRTSEIWSQAALAPQALEPLVRRPPGQRIRVGYFSADFHEHATAYLAAGLFERHDRHSFEVVAFSFGPDTRDAARQRLKAGFDRFVDVRGRADRDVARLSRELQIDIAVDLKGFTFDERSGIFAQRAAPVQVSYLGYPGTLGAAYMDYLVADRALIPPELRDRYCERIVYLPDSYQVNDRRRLLPEAVPTRDSLGLPTDRFVFCSFNNSFKILPGVFASWMKILQHTDSVLWLLADNAVAAANLRREAAALGVDPQRLVFAERVPHAAHLARQPAADLFLDTLPYNAHTTASDALWCGLPVLTQAGESFPARVGASLLQAVGCPELITGSREEYESLAIRLASDRGLLQGLRERLRASRPAAPLFDTDRFTANLERAYRAMYDRWQAGLAPEHIFIDQG